MASTFSAPSQIRRIRLSGAAPDTSLVKRKDGGRRLLGASLVVFASGPAALIAVPWLQRAHLIAATPLWLLIALLVSCSLSNALVITAFFNLVVKYFK